MICPHCHADTDTPVVEAVEFIEFWCRYPLKKAKKDAEKAWTKEPNKAAMSEGLARQLPGMLKNPKYIPYAASWIRGRRWEDETGNNGNPKIPTRVIACSYCGDSGIASGIEEDGTQGYRRCSCARGQAPGLLIPQVEGIDSAQDAI